MTILLDNDTDIDLGFNYYRIAEQVVEESLNHVNCPYECMVNIKLTNDAGIREINEKMRDIDAATDVLSFPGIPFAEEGDFSLCEMSPYSYFDAESGELMIGDIMISLDKVIAQATEYNHSTKREYAFLIAHSMLHLCGFDHEKEEDRKRMERMQDEILTNIGITRDIL